MGRWVVGKKHKRGVKEEMQKVACKNSDFEDKVWGRLAWYRTHLLPTLQRQIPHPLPPKPKLSSILSSFSFFLSFFLSSQTKHNYVFCIDNRNHLLSKFCSKRLRNSFNGYFCYMGLRAIFIHQALSVHASSRACCRAGFCFGS